MQNTTWAQIHLHSGSIKSFTNYILSFLLTLFLSVLNAQSSITVSDIFLFEIMSIILFIYIIIYFLISVSSELLGKEGTDECSKYCTEECSRNLRSQHTTFVAWRGLSWGKICSDWNMFWLLKFQLLIHDISIHCLICLALKFCLIIGTGENPSLLQHQQRR